MGKQKRLEVDNRFIQALQEKFEEEKPKLKSVLTKYTWKKQLAYLLNDFIQKELADLDIDLHDRVFHKENNEWPGYRTIERMMVTDKKAILDLIQVCGWYIFGVEWVNQRHQFSFVGVVNEETGVNNSTDETDKEKYLINKENVKATKFRAGKNIEATINDTNNNIKMDDWIAGGTISIKINED